jgi:oligopeptide/dipeptide ABC transporter ATP-binding protein
MEGVKPLLRIQDLRVYYYAGSSTVRAVDGVSLSIGHGEVLGLVGESGSGKSTLGYAILRLIPPPGRIVSGSIVFKNIDLLSLSDREMNSIRGREITMIFQDPVASLNPVVKVGDQLADIITSKLGVDRDKAISIAIEALKLVRLPEPELILERYPHELSGGMAQRVVIAMAIAVRPSLIVADEPTTALDVTIQVQVLELLRMLTRRLGTSIMLITHDIAAVSYIADRLAVMYAGKLVEEGRVDDVLNEPLHPYTQLLLSSVPRIGKHTKLASIPGEPPNLAKPPKGCRFHPRCPYARDVCRHAEPPMVEAASGRRISCWLYTRR